MSTAPIDDHEAWLRRLEESLRRASRQSTEAAASLAASVLALATFAFTPAGPWLQARLPWAANPRLETVSARQFVVIDGDQERAAFGLNPPPSQEHWDSDRPPPYPPGLAALWFYDYAKPKYGYRLLVGMEESAPQKGGPGERDFLRYQPVVRGVVWPSSTNRIYVRQWPRYSPNGEPE